MTKTSILMLFCVFLLSSHGGSLYGQIKQEIWTSYLDFRSKNRLVKKLGKELELTSEQAELLERYLAEQSEKVEHISKAIANPEGRDVPAITNALVSQGTAALNEILLDFQQDRLDQVLRQKRLNVHDMHAGLLKSRLSSELEMTDRQIDAVKAIVNEASQKIDEAKQKAYDEVQKLREEAMVEAQKELTPEQQEKLQKLLGNLAPEIKEALRKRAR